MEKIFANYSDRELVESLKAARRSEKEILIVVLKHLAEMESRKLYAHLGYPSLHSYCVAELGYDDGSASRRVMASRAYQTAPEQIEKSLESGALTLTTLAQAQRHIQRQAYVYKAPMAAAAKAEIFRTIEHKTIEETQRYFLSADPALKDTIAEKIRPISQTLTELKFTLNTEQLKKFNRIRNLYFHKNPNPSLVEIMEWMMDVTLAEKDPGEKKVRTRKAAELGPEVASGELFDLNSPPPPSAVTPKPRSISASKRTGIFKRDHTGCQFVSPITGKICNSMRGLQIDHILPVALNGQATPDNLQVLCFKHNAIKGANAPTKRSGGGV